ncbi:MAG: hypothetical protein ABH879_06815 [archaeon]
MNTFLHDAQSELKRAEHLIYVSLKYTRTVDVFRSIIERLINAFDCSIDGLLQQALDEQKISSIPPARKLKCEKLLSLYTDDKVLHENMDFYHHLRAISRAKYTRRSEYRRHVTMIATLADEITEINIDIIHEFFNKTKEFSEYVKGLATEEDA